VFWDATPCGLTDNYRHFRGNFLSVEEMCNSNITTFIYVLKFLDSMELNSRIHVVFFFFMTLCCTVVFSKHVPSKYLYQNRWLSNLLGRCSPWLLNKTLWSYHSSSFEWLISFLIVNHLLLFGYTHVRTRLLYGANQEDRNTLCVCVCVCMSVCACVCACVCAHALHTAHYRLYLVQSIVKCIEVGSSSDMP
jgi:hypothetical protein